VFQKVEVMYKIAFIGGSINSIAGYPHFIASQMDNRFKVVAGAFSTDKEVNSLTAKKWCVERSYESWRELIEKEKGRVDAVVVLAPTPLHQEIVLELLKAEIPIICEKALVSSIEEIEKISKLYDAKKHFLAVTNNYSGYPMVRELRERILNGELGEILHIRLNMPQESFLRPPKSIKYPQRWRLKDGDIPAISLDLGAHLHHLAYFLLGIEPKRVMAKHSSFSKYDVVDDVNMMLEYSNGISGNFWFSKTSLGHRNGLSIEVYGERASAIWVQENPEKLTFSLSAGDKILIDRGSDIEIKSIPLYNRMTPGHPAGFIEAFANLYNDIADEMDRFFEKRELSSSYVFGLEHAKNGIKLLDSASRSNELKSWVDINLE
jgi:predicted dehydrogenase